MDYLTTDRTGTNVTVQTLAPASETNLANIPKLQIAGPDDTGWQDVNESTTATLGPTGATGDYLAHIIVTPKTTAPGFVDVKDGGGTARRFWYGGTVSSALYPFTIDCRMTSKAGAWSIITGANVQCRAVGKFTP